MDNDGQNISAVLKQAELLFKQVALLLQSADTLMAEKGWVDDGAAAVTGSNSLDRPTAWFPQDAHRFYKRKNESVGRILPFVTAILYDRSGQENLDQPLLSAGYFDFGSSFKPDYRYWFARTHLWIPGRTDNGGWIRATADSWWKWNPKVESATTMAVPLVSITGVDELRKAVIQPLADVVSSRA